MIVDVDYKHFQELLNKHYPDHPVTEAEAAEAFHNLVGFVGLLMQINDRVGLVPYNKQKN
ncbi:MAG: hypothetical protein P4M13_08730 [Alphaproteobacteria bacterium]|nr:hypothetical protein [Alphaproteobacteria bacterium]